MFFSCFFSFRFVFSLAFLLLFFMLTPKADARLPCFLRDPIWNTVWKRKTAA